jgi:hypothetical protein
MYYSERVRLYNISILFMVVSIKDRILMERQIMSGKTYYFPG